MAYVTLDRDGNITGEFARPQEGLPGHCEIPDDAPNYVAWSATKSRYAIILAQIFDLERSVSERRKHEAIIGDADAIAFIKDIREQIAALRVSLSEASRELAVEGVLL